MSKKKVSNSQQRAIRMQQVVMGVIGVIVILSMVLALMSQY